MNNMQMESKIKNHFNSVSLPKIDVSKKVMDRVINPPSKINIFIKKKFAVILLAAIFITTTGFAVSKLITMKDKEGNILWTYDECTSEYANLEKITNEKRADLTLQPGESVLLYINKDNPDKLMSIYSEPIITYDFTDIRNNFSTYFNIPTVLLEKYNFTEGRISKEPKNVDKEAIFKEANETTTKNNPIFIKYIDQSNTITGIGGTYSNGTNTIKVNISQWIGKQLISHEENYSENQKIELEDFQVLYQEEEKQNSVTWIKNEVYYKITSPSDEASMDDLIKVAKAVINLNK